MIDVEVLVDKLNCMAKEDIYELMKKEGIKGVQAAAAHCVIAEYLRAQGVVSPDSIFGVCPVSIYVSGRDFSVSQELARFMMAFDHGDYPELSLGALAEVDRMEIEQEMNLIGEAL